MRDRKILADTDADEWLATWRDDWEFQESSMPMPQAWHRCGLCFFLEFEQLDEKGNWGWVVWDDDVSQSRLEELRSEMGDEAFFQLSARLGRQAKTRWHELGYNDWSLQGSPPEHGDGRGDSDCS